MVHHGNSWHFYPLREGHVSFYHSGDKSREFVSNEYFPSLYLYDIYPVNIKENWITNTDVT